MNGRMEINHEKYTESLNKMPQPLATAQLPKAKMNLAGLARYAKKRGIALNILTEDEIRKFVPSYMEAFRKMC